MITSSGNIQVKNVIQLLKKAKSRREQKLFVVEGIRMFREIPEAWLEKVYVSESFYRENSALCPQQTEIVEDKVFSHMSDTMTPQGVLCLVRQPQYDLEDLLEQKNPLFMILEDLQDPGNLGTIFRTAEGAGVNGIIMNRGCVDIYNPKTIRSTMGSIYRMPFVYVEDLQEILPVLRKKEVKTYAAHLNGTNSYRKENYRGGTAFFIGNEGNGLSQQLSDEADCLIRIPMEGKVESLNASVAAAILMYEAHAQREEESLQFC